MSGIAGLMTFDGRPPAPSIGPALVRALARRGGRARCMTPAPGLLLVACGDASAVAAGGGTLVRDGGREAPVEETLMPNPWRADAAAALGDGGGLALAVHDQARDRLVLSRDVFGIKPLYAAETPHGFAFASQPRVLIDAGLVAPKLARRGGVELLQLQFVTGSDSIFDGVSRVLPGEALSVGRGRVVERRRTPALTDQPAPGGEAEALQALDRLFDQSPALSGDDAMLILGPGIHGVALLAALMRRGGGPVATCGVHFAGAGGEDAARQRRDVVRAAGAEHMEIGCDEGDFWRLLPSVAAALDDPAADYTAVALWRLAEAVRRDARTVIAADGGRELFAAYGRYRSALRPWWLGGRAMRARGVLDGFDVLRERPTGWRDGIVAAESAAASRRRSRLQVAQATDCADWLPNNVLLRLDRCLTGCGIAARLPYLDPPLASFAFALPDALKVRQGMGSWLLRRWLDLRLPAAVPPPRRQRWPAPIGEWLGRQGLALGELVAAQPGVAELCRPEAVRRLFAAEGKRETFAAWTLLFYALWHQCQLGGTPPDGDTFAVLADRRC